MQGNKPSGSCPSRVYTSVWHSALAMTFTRISPARGGATTTVSSLSGWLAAHATAALHL